MADVHQIAATLAAAVISKTDRGGLPAEDAVKVYLDVLEVLERRMPSAGPKVKAK